MKNRFVIHVESAPPLVAEARMQQETRMLKLVGSARPVEETLMALIRAIEAQSSDILCSIVLLDADRRSVRYGAAPSLPAYFKRIIEAVVTAECGDPSRTAIFRREQACVADIATDPLWANDREPALRQGLHTCWSQPILDAERRVLGTLAIYYRLARSPQTSDQWFFEMAAHAAAIAIHRHENGERMRRWQDIVLEQEKRLQALKAELHGLLQALGGSDPDTGGSSK